MVFGMLCQALHGTNLATTCIMTDQSYGSEGITMMKLWYRFFLPAMVLGSAFVLGGCYTQIAPTREARYEESSYTAQPADTTGDNYDQSYNNDYDENGNWSPGYRVGFDYYYPTLAFAFTSYDPWYWRYSGWYYYDPFVCGTYYPAIYAGGYPYWHFPSSYYPYYPWRTYAHGGRWHGTTRDIGSTRGSGVVRGGTRDDGGYRPVGGSGGVNAPPAYRSASNPRSGNPSSTSPRVSGGRSGRTQGPASGQPGVRSGSTRGNGGRGGSQASPPRTYTPPPSRGSGSRGGSERSYSPPPSPPSPQSTPPPSNGGQSSGSSGSGRGGRGR